MDFLRSDFNGADAYYSGAGAAEWADLEAIVRGMPLYLHPSDQAGKKGSPIFDPKATNAHLNREAQGRGWIVVAVPPGLTEFGNDWDAGKGGTLAEWQFSNYPFLWNNVIRTEAVLRNQIGLAGVGQTKALTVVTKSGLFPASNSTLYYEQAKAQLDVVATFKTFSVPIRLVGLVIPEGAAQYAVVWSQYPGRYARVPDFQEQKSVNLKWGRAKKYETPSARFSVV